MAIAGLVPVFAGLAGVVLGPEMAGGGGGADVSLDSHFRYLSGLLLGVGLVFWSLIPNIARNGPVFRALTFAVFVGGVGRAIGISVHGMPAGPMVFGLVMELIVTPLLCLWQAAIAERPRG